ncbi:PAAR domain-containing protein [Proteus terrae]|uniref:PAAR domain-containing protein n=1 Tax=Proteus terrae TaxID=1574161 RepID=UPI003526331B
MATGYFLRVGDKTTCGGQIITGDDTFRFYGASAAREGDLATCGKHSGTYQILGGISYVLGNNRRIAGTIDSFSSCPCKAKLINSIQDCYITESSRKPSTRTENSLTNEANTTTEQPHHIRYLCTDDNNLPLANYEYHLYLDDNQSVTGITDSEGYTSWHQTKSANNVFIHILKD